MDKKVKHIIFILLDF